jgi:hypothetical protein
LRFLGVGIDKAQHLSGGSFGFLHVGLVNQEVKDSII